MIFAVLLMFAELVTGAEAPAAAEAVVAPEAPVVAEAAAEAAPVEAEAEAADAKAAQLPRSVKITSARTDYDRKEGVLMFDRDVFVDDAEYQMHAEQLYVFLDGTNDLKRIVALGGVSITNDARVGTCAKASYSKATNKIVMYGDGDVKAKLVDNGKRRSEVEGTRITFWIDSEQVEVEGSTVTLDAGGFGGKDGAKKLLGK